MTRDVGRYVEGCDLCQRMKNRTEEPAGKLKLSEVPKEPWSHLTVDFITKLPVVAGKYCYVSMLEVFKQGINSCIEWHKRTQ